MGLFTTLFAKRSQPTSIIEPDDVVPTPELSAEPAQAPTVISAETASVATTPPAAPADASQARAEAEEVVRSVVAELPDFLAVAVVESASGHILAGQWAEHSGGATEVAAANAEIVRQTQQAIEALQLGPAEQLEDILITLRNQLHLLRVLPQSGGLLYLAMRAQDTNLGLARSVLRAQAA